MTRPYFECVGTIAAGFWMLQEHLKAEGRRSPLDVMIDEASGYDKAKREWLAAVVRDIRDAQAEIGEDTAGADEVLAALARQDPPSPPPDPEPPR
jgi:ABC-type nitrate/sulfonate/bicarbonate transport system substrate-binding protein